MKNEEKQELIDKFYDFLYKNSNDSFSQKQGSIKIEDALKGLEDILNSFECFEWYSEMIRPEEDIDIIVRDDKGKEYDNHYWNGHRYYESCGEDGYPSDVDIVSWRYK